MSVKSVSASAKATPQEGARERAANSSSLTGCSSPGASGRWWSVLAWLAGLCWLGLSFYGGAVTFQGADSAEFLTVAATAGVAHPPGYPLYVLLGALAVRLSPLAVAQTLSLLAALFGLGTLLGVFCCIRELSGDRRAALFGAATLALSAHFWRHATHPEAFALLACFAAWLACTAVRAANPKRLPSSRRRSWWLYALLAGLASAHHHTIILTAPLGIYLLWSLVGHRTTRLERRRWLLAGGGLCFLLGLTPYLHLFLAGPHLPPGSWGNLDSWQGVVAHFLREEYGTFRSGLAGGTLPFWFHPSSYLESALSWSGTFPLGLSLLWLLGLFSPLWLWFPQREQEDNIEKAREKEGAPVQAEEKEGVQEKPEEREGLLKNSEGEQSPLWTGGRGAFAALVLSWALSGLFFPALLHPGSSPVEQFIVRRFFLLPDVFLGIFSGLGVALLLRWASALVARRLLLFSLSLLLLLSAVIQFPRVSSRHRRWLERYAMDLLQGLPRKALLLEASDDALCFGLTYLQEVRNIRRDVLFVCLPLLARRWYVRQLRQRWPDLPYRWNPRQISSVSLIRRSLPQRPVFSTLLYNRSIQRSFVWVPRGLAWQASPLAGTSRPSPSPAQLEVELLRRFRCLRSQRPFPHRRRDPWPALILERYRYPWLALAQAYHQQGDLAGVRRAMRYARRFAPAP